MLVRDVHMTGLMAPGLMTIEKAKFQTAPECRPHYYLKTSVVMRLTDVETPGVVMFCNHCCKHVFGLARIVERRRLSGKLVVATFPCHLPSAKKLKCQEWARRECEQARRSPCTPGTSSSPFSLHLSTDEEG